jgi:hypothetical protein
MYNAGNASRQRSLRWPAANHKRVFNPQTIFKAVFDEMVDEAQRLTPAYSPGAVPAKLATNRRAGCTTPTVTAGSGVLFPAA